MNPSRMLRRGLIAVTALGYYLAVVYLTGISTRLTTMAQFFGHALIYLAGVGLVSALFYLIERASFTERKEALAAEAIKLRRFYAERAELGERSAAP